MCFVQRYFGDDDDVLTPLLHGWLHQKMPAIFLHYHISLFTTSVLVHSSLSYWYNTHCIVCWEVIISDKQNLKLKWSCWRCWWEWIYSCSYVCVWLLTLAWPIDATLHHITTSHITLSWIHTQCCTNTYHWLVKNKYKNNNGKCKKGLHIVLLCDVMYVKKNKMTMMKAVIKGCGTILFMIFCTYKKQTTIIASTGRATAKKNKFYFCTARSLGAQQSTEMNSKREKIAISKHACMHVILVSLEFFAVPIIKIQVYTHVNWRSLQEQTIFSAALPQPQQYLEKICGFMNMKWMHDCIIIVIITSAAFLSSTSTAEDQQTIHCTHTNMTILLKYL